MSLPTLHSGIGFPPPFFPVGNAPQVGLVAPEDRRGVPVRTWVRALAGMQKEAVVLNGATQRTWRLISDARPVPWPATTAPLALCAPSRRGCGWASYMNEILALAKQRGSSSYDIQLTLGNHYSMEGSALAGTDVGRRPATRAAGQGSWPMQTSPIRGAGFAAPAWQPRPITVCYGAFATACSA